MRGLLLKGALGVATKLGLIAAVAAVLLVFLRWHRGAEVERFCNEAFKGMSRTEVADRASAAGLRVQRGAKRDQVTNPKWAPGLAWCILDHDGASVTSSSFARE